MQNEMYMDFLLEISTLASKLDILSKSASSALQEWNQVKRQSISFKDYIYARGKFIENSSPLERIYDNLAFELIRKVRQAEEFLYDEELNRLKKIVGNDIKQIFLSWECYQIDKDKY
jgi:hypothetical protein